MSYLEILELGNIGKAINGLALAARDYRSLSYKLPGLREFWEPFTTEAGELFGLLGGISLRLSPINTPTFGLDGFPCYSLNGTTQYFTKTDSPFLRVSGTESYIAAAQRGFTVGAWVKVVDNSAVQMIAEKSSASDFEFHLVLTGQGDGTLTTQFTVGYPGPQPVVGASIQQGQWSFICGRFTPSLAVEIYVNGAWSSFTTAVHSSIAAGTGNFSFGAAHAAASYFLQGEIGPLFMCATSLTNATIETLYQAGRRHIT